jgi:hypothetical protein
MLTKAFWVDARERVIRTFVQVLVATMPAQTVASDLFSGNWDNLQVLGTQALTAAGAAAISLLWSLLAAKKPNTISPASSVSIDGKPEFVDVSDPAVINEYLDTLDAVVVDEAGLPDEHTTAVEAD